MSDFFAWFEKSRKKSSERSWQDRHRLLLAIEILEPRQMLAGDGLGGFVPAASTDYVCPQVCDGVVLVPHWSESEEARVERSDGLADRDGPMRIHLEEIADEIGELFEIEDRETWWPDAE